MSDVEQAASRAPIITSAVGKLRSLSGNASQFGETDGLVDAFAEVFAQMTIASSPTAEPSEPNTDTDSEAGEEVQQSSESNDRERSRDNESADAGQANAVINDQPLVGQQQDDISIDADSIEREEVSVEDNASKLSTDRSEHQLEQEAVVVDIEAYSDEGQENQVESDQVAESTVVAAVDANPDRRNRRETKSTTSEETTKAPVQQTDGDSGTKSTGIESNHQQRETGSEQGGSDQQQSSEPAEKTTRQIFLDARRSEHRGGDSSSNQTPDTNASRAVESSAESQTLAQPGLGNSPAKPHSAVRASVAAQPLVDPNAGSAKNAAAKPPVSAVGSRVETRTGTQPVQNETVNRIDRGTGRDTRPSKNDSSSTAARVKLVQRVSRAFQHLGPEGGVVRLRLAPAELGSVRVEMQINQRKVHARVVAETEAASAALREHLPDLRARLESYGMQIEQLEVETESNDQQSGLPFDREPQQRESQQRQPRRRLASEQQQPTDDLSDQAISGPGLSHRSVLASTGVDLRV